MNSEHLFLQKWRSLLKIIPTLATIFEKTSTTHVNCMGESDEYFPESGAEAFKKDVDDIDYNIYDTGYFALEEDGDEIIEKIRAFMAKVLMGIS